MVIPNLILSNKTYYRPWRHLLSLVVFASLFHITNNNRTLLYLACYLPSCILSIYVFPYILLPYIQEKKYRSFALGFFTIFCLTLLTNYYTSLVFFNNWGSDPFTPNMIVGLAFYNQINALSVGVIALSIKATKNWYLLYLENQKLEKEKVTNDLKLEKTNLYPEFILPALGTIQLKIKASATEAPVLLMQLSDILSYLLYDSQEDFIQLEREMIMVRNAMAFEKMKRDNQTFLYLFIAGNTENKYITPLTLFRLMQNSLQMISHEEKGLKEARFKISIENEFLFFELLGIYSNKLSKVDSRKDTSANMREQLTGLCRDAQQIEVVEDEDIYSLSLRLQLTKLTTFENILNPYENK